MMCDIADVKKRYESVCIIEDNKDRIIKVWFVGFAETPEEAYQITYEADI